MKKKSILAIGIICLILMSRSVYATESRISEEELEESSNIETVEIDRKTAITLLSTEVTVVETWDISATEEDNVTATLYNNGTLIISGTGNMKNYSTINIENSEYSPWYDNRNNIKSVHIEVGVNNIGNAAFFDCRQLINIIIPEGVTNIGEYTLRYCSSLTKIVLPTSVSSIGVSAFMDCSSLSDIRIPDKVTNISSGLFYNCSVLENINIPEGVTDIGRNAFGKCSSLTSITIPASVRIIEEYPFNLCNKLTSINVDERNSFYTSDEGVLFNKDKTSLICYPANKSDTKEYIVPNTVRTIEAYSFNCCSNLEKIVIQEGTTHIGGIAFYNCSSLTNITIPESVTNIGNGILSNCVNLKNINVYCNSYAEKYVTQNYGDKLNIIHTEVIDKGVTPTCTSVGLTEGKHCSVCQKILIAQQEVAVLGHNYGNWVVTKEATCSDDGSKERECSVCQNKETEVIVKLGHDYESIVTAPTCTEKGYTVHTCAKCNDSYVDTYVDSLGHNFGTWIIDKEPTYEEEGYKYRICTNCNTEKEEQVIPILTKDELQVTTTYSIKEQDNVKFIISTVNTTVSKILSNITANREIKVVDKSGKELGTNDLVETGAKVVTKEDNKEIYTVVLQGDVNCDGKITFDDIIRTNAIRINQDENKISKAELFAADIDDSQKIEFRDIIKINAIRINSLVS